MNKYSYGAEFKLQKLKYIFIENNTVNLVLETIQ
jgi:hypothetical protein